MEYINRLIIAAKNYLRVSTCNCGYKQHQCPQEMLQSIVDEYKPHIPLSTPVRRKKRDPK